VLYTAAEVVPFLFHMVELQQNGELVTRLSEREAQNLCSLEFVVGRMGRRRDADSGEQVAVLRYLELTVSRKKLKETISRVSVKTLQCKAEDSRTFSGEPHRTRHDFRKCNAYAGGVTRLLPIRMV